MKRGNGKGRTLSFSDTLFCTGAHSVYPGHTAWSYLYNIKFRRTFWEDSSEGRLEGKPLRHLLSNPAGQQGEHVGAWLLLPGRKTSWQRKRDLLAGQAAAAALSPGSSKPCYLFSFATTCHLSGQIWRAGIPHSYSSNWQPCSPRLVVSCSQLAFQPPWWWCWSFPSTSQSQKTNGTTIKKYLISAKPLGVQTQNQRGLAQPSEERVIYDH